MLFELFWARKAEKLPICNEMLAFFIPHSTQLLPFSFWGFLSPHVLWRDLNFIYWTSVNSCSSFSPLQKHDACCKTEKKVHMWVKASSDSSAKGSETIFFPRMARISLSMNSYIMSVYLASAASLWMALQTKMYAPSRVQSPSTIRRKTGKRKRSPSLLKSLWLCKVQQSRSMESMGTTPSTTFFCKARRTSFAWGNWLAFNISNQTFKKKIGILQKYFSAFDHAQIYLCLLRSHEISTIVPLVLNHQPWILYLCLTLALLMILWPFADFGIINWNKDEENKK